MRACVLCLGGCGCWCVLYHYTTQHNTPTPTTTTTPTPTHQHNINTSTHQHHHASPEDDHLVGLLAQLGLDEPQEVLLVHAGAVVDVGVDLADVVEVAVGGDLLREELLVGVEHDC